MARSCICGHGAEEHGLDGICMIIGCGCQGIDLELDEGNPLVPTCWMCGCTEANPCEEGCSWVTLDPETNLGLCTACAEG